MDPDALTWLLSAPGSTFLARAHALDAELGGDEAALQRALRREPEADGARVAGAISQIRLREAAVEKFGSDAARMYFTRAGLEQATRRSVATHRAGRLQAFGTRTLVDLCCGIGGDLVAAVRTGATCAAVDSDPLTAQVAQANLDALELPGAVGTASAESIDLTGFDVVFADPARRGPAGRATTSISKWSPSWEFIQQVLARDSCVKVAPGIDHQLIPHGVEAEWVSDRGEVKEAALWSGRLATATKRATVIGEGGLATLTDEDDPGAEVRDVGAFLYEPDGAVIRAGLVTAVADGVGGGLVDEHIAYVTADESFRTPFARGYRVLEQLPYREKQLKAALRERNVGTLTIKKRGVSIEPAALRKRLALSGDEEATIVLTRARGEGTALLVQPF